MTTLALSRPTDVDVAGTKYRGARQSCAGRGDQLGAITLCIGHAASLGPFMGARTTERHDAGHSSSRAQEATAARVKRHPVGVSPPEPPPISDQPGKEIVLEPVGAGGAKVAPDEPEILNAHGLWPDQLGEAEEVVLDTDL